MSKPIRFQWAINHGIAEEMRRDPNVFIVGEDVGKPGGPSVRVLAVTQSREGKGLMPAAPISATRRALESMP